VEQRGIGRSFPQDTSFWSFGIIPPMLHTHLVLLLSEEQASKASNPQTKQLLFRKSGGLQRK